MTRVTGTEIDSFALGFVIDDVHTDTLEALLNRIDESSDTARFVRDELANRESRALDDSDDDRARDNALDR